MTKFADYYLPVHTCKKVNFITAYLSRIRLQIEALRLLSQITMQWVRNISAAELQRWKNQLTLEGCQQDWCELHHRVPGDLGRRKYPTDWSPSCISRAHQKHPILSEVIMCFWKYPLIAYIFVITKGKRAIANCIDETIVRNDKRWPYSEGASTYFKL